MKRGSSLMLMAPEDAAGQIIKVPDPRRKGREISVAVPAGATAGTPIMVPVLSEKDDRKDQDPADQAVAASIMDVPEEEVAGWGTDLGEDIGGILLDLF
eukprot:101944-Amphidinium_carterae.4